MSRLRLSKDFYLDEFTRSVAAEHRGWENMPGPDHVIALERLVQVLLQPLRAGVGAPIVPTSGFRSKRLNKAVGGHRHSAHCDGRAADIHSSGHQTPPQLAKTVVELCLPYDKMIVYPGFLHIQVRRPMDGEPRGACYAADVEQGLFGPRTEYRRLRM